MHICLQGGGEDTTTAPSGGEKASDSQSEAGPIEMKSSASPSGEGTSSPGGKESPDGGKESSGNTSPTGDKEVRSKFDLQIAIIAHKNTRVEGCTLLSLM